MSVALFDRSAAAGLQKRRKTHHVIPVLPEIDLHQMQTQHFRSGRNDALAAEAPYGVIRVVLAVNCDALQKKKDHKDSNMMR